MALPWRGAKAIKPVVSQPLNLIEARRSAIKLYRDICREIPHLTLLFDLAHTHEETRRRVANMFRKNGELKDPRTVNLLVSRGYMELEEALAQFKQKPHIEQMLDMNASIEEEEGDFLEDFFSGKNK
eukprot:g4816.t1